MCGINGIFNFNGRPVSSGCLETMNRLLVRRGPDDEGYFVDRFVGLSMRRLSIIDVDNGRQPIFSEDGSIAVVMNGEIYNYVELRSDLVKKGHRFATSSDTEVIAHLYEEMGPALVDGLNGMFAFALWDRSKETLYIFRDRAGIKPLFYSSGGGSLVFSSDLRAVAAITGKREIDISSFLSYLGLSYVPCPRTIFNGISKLEPGHSLMVNASGTIKKRYWEVGGRGGLHLPSDNDYAECALELLRDSIRLQLRSDVPVGAFLSGGMDSSAIVGLAAKEAAGPLSTFSVAFEGGLNELPTARIVQERCSTVHAEEVIKDELARKTIPEVIERMDEPLADNATVPALILSRKAAEAGVKVVLNGSGGDELFGGYTRYLRAGRAAVAGLFPAAFRRLATGVFGGVEQERLLRATEPGLSYAFALSGVSFTLVNKALKDSGHFRELLDVLISLYERHVPKGGMAEDMMRFDFNEYLSGDVLSVLDKMTMGASIEGRVPFLDHRLIELLFSFPEGVKLRDGRLKGLMRKMLEGIVPEEVLNQPKAGLSGPTWRWVKGPLKAEVQRFLVDEPDGFLREHIDREAIAKAVERVGERREYAETLYSLYIFSSWYRRHVDGSWL